MTSQAGAMANIRVHLGHPKRRASTGAAIRKTRGLTITGGKIIFLLV